MTAILYYLIIKPLSLLPLPILHLVSDFLYFVIYRIVGYRKKVVFVNLRNSFPEKSEKEIEGIASKFYHHLCDTLIESIKLFSISKKEIIKRCKVLNPEVSDRFAKEGRHVAVITGHYANWEIAATSFGAQMMHTPLGLIAPIKNKFFYEKMVKSRTRFGTDVVSMWDFKDIIDDRIKNSEGVIAPSFVGDQAPSSNKKKLYWTTFLNQDTPVMLGVEKYAKQYNLPVVFVKIDRVKRGYYELRYVLLEENPQATQTFEITEKHTRFLEKIIKNKPELWLWSHRRWKHKRPQQE